jgi:hypothetical protein
MKSKDFAWLSDEFILYCRCFPSAEKSESPRPELLILLLHDFKF